MTQQAIATEALNRATSGNSVANYDSIFRGFMAKGIALDEIQPRENVLTFHAWKALGRVVRKGEHGVKVATFVPVKGKAETPEVEGKPGFNMARTVTVFHISQTKEMDEPETLTPEHVEAIDQQTAKFVAARMSGTPVSFRYVDGTHETFNA
jgi:antirestriction protein ArdC